MWTQASKIRDLYMNEVCGPWYKGLRELRKLPETTAAGSSNNVRICGDAVAMGYLGAFAHLQTFESCVNFPGIKSCVVLGGGFGHEAHTLLSLWPNISKIVYVDIPPMLYYGSQYLKSVLGGAEVIDYRVTRALSQVVLADVPEKVVAIPPWEIDKIIGSIEFLYNSCSLQEMGSDNVSFYAKAFQRLLDKSARLSFVMWATDNTVAQLGGRDLTHSEVLDRFEYVNFQELAGPTVRIEADAYNYYCGTVAS